MTDEPLLTKVTEDADVSAAAPLKLQQYLTYRLSRVQAKLNAQASRILRDASGITLTQWRVIAFIGSAERTRLSDIARETALDKGLLSRNLKALVEEGVVSAEVDANDNRVQFLSLSHKGQAIYAQTLPVTLARQAKLRAELSDEEERIFREVLDKLERATDD